jgi:hypothetical protein
LAGLLLPRQSKLHPGRQAMMITAYVLIVIIMNNGRISTITHEFNDKKNCELTLRNLSATFANSTTVVYGGCYDKGEKSGLVPY